MAASRGIRAAGLGHGAVQRDRQPADRRVAEAEPSSEALNKVCDEKKRSRSDFSQVFSTSVLLFLFWVGCIGEEEAFHFGYQVNGTFW